MKLRFSCPECHRTVATEALAGPSWSCKGCGYALTPVAPTAAAELTACRACGNEELFVQKAFPHWLGMGIVVAASLGFMLFHATYHFYAAWGCLVGAFGLDVLLYFRMGNETVCYRCGARHAGFAPNPTHAAFELATAERYRQEKLRRQQMGQTR